MKSSIKINSLPLSDVLRDLADEIGGELTSDCDDYEVTIPPSYGSGVIRGINFEGGMGYIYYDCTFLQDFEIQFVTSEVHPLKFIFCALGTLCHRFEHSTQMNFVVQYQSCILASEVKNGHILMFRGGIPTIINSIEVDRAVFGKSKKCDLSLYTNENLKKIFLDVIGNFKFVSIGYYSLVLADLFQKINNLEGDPFTNKIMKEGICLQILGIQLELAKVEPEESTRRLLRKSEIKQIETAAIFLNDQLSDFTNIEDLSKLVGLNVNKLQDGFKSMYQHTVNNYIQNVRIQQAAELLQNSDHSISEIVHLVGLTSKSYFSMVFRKRYGITPSQFRMGGRGRGIKNFAAHIQYGPSDHNNAGGENPISPSKN